MHTHAHTTTEHRAGRRSSAASHVENTGVAYLIALEFIGFYMQDFILRLIEGLLIAAFVQITE